MEIITCAVGLKAESEEPRCAIVVTMFPDCHQYLFLMAVDMVEQLSGFILCLPETCFCVVPFIV